MQRIGSILAVRDCSATTVLVIYCITFHRVTILVAQVVLTAVGQTERMQRAVHPLVCQSLGTYPGLQRIIVNRMNTQRYTYGIRVFHTADWRVTENKETYIMGCIRLAYRSSVHVRGIQLGACSTLTQMPANAVMRIINQCPEVHTRMTVAILQYRMINHLITINPHNRRYRRKVEGRYTRFCYSGIHLSAIRYCYKLGRIVSQNVYA